MPVLRLTTTDPFHNLAIEELLLDHIATIGPTMLLWRNERCVVIGRHQNPWVECDLERMQTDAVPLVRRISGGGAVYHEPGNTNFSFLAPASHYDQDEHFRIVLDALRRLGIPAGRNERNDLLAGGRKFSGSAYRHTRGNSLHHGTLLVDADLDRLTAYLAGSGGRIESKATASVRSRVVNLTEYYTSLTHEALCDALEESFKRMRANEELSVSVTRSLSEVRGLLADVGDRARSDADTIGTRAEELRSREWLFGHTPKFTVRHQLGGIEIVVTVRHGRVQEVDADPPATPPLRRLRDTIIGDWYDPKLFEEA